MFLVIPRMVEMTIIIITIVIMYVIRSVAKVPVMLLWGVLSRCFLILLLGVLPQCLRHCYWECCHGVCDTVIGGVGSVAKVFVTLFVGSVAKVFVVLLFGVLPRCL